MRHGSTPRAMRAGATERDVMAALTTRAAERGAAWFPELNADRTAARLTRRHPRRHALVVILELSDGVTSRLAVAKMPRPYSGPQLDGLPSRPTLSPAAEPGELARAWYRGLERSHRHFTALADPHLGSIRPLDLLEDLDAVVMEYVDRPNLRTRIVAEARWHASGEPVDRLIEHAGRWLREYHAAGGLAELPLRCPTRSDLLSAFDRFLTYLADVSGEVRYFQALGEMAARMAEHYLPDTLPLVVAHGDYAPRNVFVGPGDRVAGFDAAPRVLGPSYEDVARFLVAVRTSGVQVLSFGRAYATARLDSLQERFLHGYYAGEPPPLPALRAFELLVLLNKYSAVIARSGSDSLRVRLRARLRTGLYFRRLRVEVDRRTRLSDAGRSPA